MHVYSKLHTVVKDTETRWHTEPFAGIVYDTDCMPFNQIDTMLWIEGRVEIFPHKDADSGPQFFDTVMYKWGSSAHYFKTLNPLNVVPTLCYWVCQGHEWG